MVGVLVLICTLYEMLILGVCLKWLNDVWVKGYKIVGFLVEYGGLLFGKFKIVFSFIIIVE